VGLGSLVAGWLCLRNSGYLRIGVWFVTGSISYAALYCLAFALFTNVGWLGVLLMFAAMIWSGVFSVGLSFGQGMFRKAAETSTNWIVAKTIIQIGIVWSIILGIFPYMITLVEDKLGVPRLQFAYQKPLAVVLLVMISALGIWAAVTMSRIGLGTPLPLDHAKRLVVSGPYAYWPRVRGRSTFRIAHRSALRTYRLADLAAGISSTRRVRPAGSFWRTI
jgi:hypothetical protein